MNTEIKLKNKYASGLLANTDLHAGGLFFCIIYKNVLLFEEGGKVTLSKKLMDAFRPMDDLDVKHIEKYKIIGSYTTNERGYIVCNFTSDDLILTGLPTTHPDVLAFHAFDKRLSRQWSEVFELEV